MKLLNDLFTNNREWAERIKAEDPNFFATLSAQQAPEYLWIGCSDSRVPANQLMGLLPGDVFVDHLGVKLIWIPHSYNGCKQHGPDEHFLIAPAREGFLAFTGMWWDLGQGGTP